MTNKISPNKVGLVLGVFAGGMHAVWSVLVALGWAQVYVNFVARLHFIESPFSFRDFDIATAILLVVVTSLIGYVVGNILAWIWNYLQR